MGCYGIESEAHFHLSLGIFCLMAQNADIDLESEFIQWETIQPFNGMSRLLSPKQYNYIYYMV